MEVISLSLDSETLEKLEEIQERSSFNGRSELFRKAIDQLHRTQNSLSDMEGSINAVIVVKHPHKRERSVTEIAHKHDGMLKSQLHSKLDEENCIEIFQVEGEAGEVRSLYNQLKGSKDTESVQIIRN